MDGLPVNVSQGQQGPRWKFTKQYENILRARVILVELAVGLQIVLQNVEGRNREVDREAEQQPMRGNPGAKGEEEERRQHGGFEVALPLPHEEQALLLGEESPEQATARPDQQESGIGVPQEPPGGQEEQEDELGEDREEEVHIVVAVEIPRDELFEPARKEKV